MRRNDNIRKKKLDFAMVFEYLYRRLTTVMAYSAHINKLRKTAYSLAEGLVEHRLPACERADAKRGECHAFYVRRNKWKAKPHRFARYFGHPSSTGWKPVLPYALLVGTLLIGTGTALQAASETFPVNTSKLAVKTSVVKKAIVKVVDERPGRNNGKQVAVPIFYRAAVSKAYTVVMAHDGEYFGEGLRTGYGCMGDGQTLYEFTSTTIMKITRSKPCRKSVPWRTRKP